MITDPNSINLAELLETHLQQLQKNPSAGTIIHSDSETAGAGAPSVPDSHSDGHAKMSVPGAPRVS